MLAHTFRIAFLVLPLALVGCGGGGGSNSPSDDSVPDTPKPRNPTAFKLLKKAPIVPEVHSQSKRMEVAFGEMREGCAEVGGTFNERTLTCLCPDRADGIPQFFVTKTESKEIPVFQPQCFAGRTHLDRKIDSSYNALVRKYGASGFFTSVRNLFDPRIDADHQINLNVRHKDNEEYMYRVAAAFDEREPVIFLDPNFADSRDAAQTTINVDLDISATEPPYDPATLKSLAKVWDRYKINEKDRTRFDFHFYARYFESITPITGPKLPGNLGFDFPEIPADNPDAEDIARLKAATTVLTDYLNGGRMFRDAFVTDVRILTEGCHLRCFVTTAYELGGLEYRYERMYLYGTVVYSRLMEYSGDLQAAGMSYRTMALLGKGNGISAVFVNRRNTADLGASWTVAMYDEKLKLSTEFKDTLIDNRFKLKENVTINNSRLKETESVIILGSGMDYRDSAVLNWVKRGPHQSFDYLKGGSILGWWDIPAGDSNAYHYSRFYDGFFRNNYGAVAQKESNYLNQVARHVVGFHSKTGDVSFVPFSNDRRLQHGSELYKAMAKTGARVVLGLDQQQVGANKSCAIDNAYLDGKYLFILQAGYGGRVNPDVACLPNVKTGPNRIVVASGFIDGESTADWGDRGDDFADISANPFDGFEQGSDLPGGEGQSFAAARVAHTTAKLLKQFRKELNPEQVRLAILLSAQMHHEWINDTRTGGTFNADNAQKAAQYMADVINGEITIPTDLTREQLMARIVKASGALRDPARIDKQVQRLVAKGI